MLEFLTRIGRNKAVILLTIVAWFPAVLLTLLFTVILDNFGMNTNPRTGMIIASAVEIIITPIITYHVIGQSIRIFQLEKRMRELASYDSLTGLFARREFLDRLDMLFLLSHRSKDPLSLIMIDVDHLKKINDQHGHFAGDKVLESFGQLVKDTIRTSDIACRYGGDEFIILLPSTSTEQALLFSDRLYENIRENRNNIEEIYDYSVSMGLATYPYSTINTVVELIAAADKALYRSKELRQDKVHVFNEHQI